MVQKNKTVSDFHETTATIQLMSKKKSRQICDKYCIHLLERNLE